MLNVTRSSTSRHRTAVALLPPIFHEGYQRALQIFEYRTTRMSRRWGLPNKVDRDQVEYVRFITSASVWLRESNALKINKNKTTLIVGGNGKFETSSEPKMEASRNGCTGLLPRATATPHRGKTRAPTGPTGKISPPLGHRQKIGWIADRTINDSPICDERVVPGLVSRVPLSRERASHDSSVIRG